MFDEYVPPDEALAKKIVANLLDEGLIPERRKEQIISKLLSGTASEGDWRSWVYTAHVDSEREEVDDDGETRS